MEKRKSIGKNYIFNLVYQIFSLIVPFITAPYVARVLQSDGVGINAFVASIASYFVLFAAFGFNFYAQREIAKNRSDKKRCSVIFSEILICKFITTAIAVAINLAFVFSNVYGDYSFYMGLLTISIASPALDITFLYRGLEEFGNLTLKDLLIKIIGIVLIFVFVKSKNDLWIYILCHCLTTLLSTIILWIGVPKRIDKIAIQELKPFHHFWPAFRLLIPTIATSIYVVLDKSLIGVLIPGTIEVIGTDGTVSIIKIADMENGFYQQAETIVKMPLTILTSLGLVILPRNALYFKEKKYDLAKENVYRSFSFTFMIGSALTFGIAAIATNFIPWFLGDGYEKVPYLMMAFSPIILAIGCNAILGQQYLIPKGDDKIYTIAVVSGAIINLVLNLILIPILLSFGALIATVSAELIIFLIEYFYLRKELSAKKIFLHNLKYVVYGIIMFTVVFLLSSFVLKNSSILNTFILVICGMVIYISFLLFTKDKLFFDICSFFWKLLKQLFGRKKRSKEL